MTRPARTLFLIAASLAGGAPVAAQRPAAPARPTHTRPVPPPSAAERYRRALLPVRTCADFFRHVGTLPDAKPLLRNLFVSGIPEQTGRETQDGFVNRIVRRLFLRLGDPSRIHTIGPIGDGASYDTSTGMLSIGLAGDPYEATLDARRARSGTQAAPTTVELRAHLEFPPATLPSGVKVRMSPASAAAFLHGGGRLHILSLIQDYGEDEAVQPDGSRIAYHLVRLKPHCAVITSGATTLHEWRYDDWRPETGQ